MYWSSSSNLFAAAFSLLSFDQEDSFAVFAVFQPHPVLSTFPYASVVNPCFYRLLPATINKIIQLLEISYFVHPTSNRSEAHSGRLFCVYVVRSFFKISQLITFILLHFFRIYSSACTCRERQRGISLKNSVKCHWLILWQIKLTEIE